MILAKITLKKMTLAKNVAIRKDAKQQNDAS